MKTGRRHTKRKYKQKGGSWFDNIRGDMNVKLAEAKASLEIFKAKVKNRLGVTGGTRKHRKHRKK